jgi:hypothetical protein
MVDETTEDIQKKIDALPPEIKELIYSPQMQSILQQVGAKNQLHVDQIGALESEVVAAMIGVSPLAELSENISDTLGIDKLKSDAVVKDIDSLLLSKIRGQMKANDQTPKPTTEEKSVVMPSSMKPAAPNPILAPLTPLKPAPPIIPTVPTMSPTGTSMIIPKATPAPLPKPAMPMDKVNTILTQPTVSMAPATPSKPDASTPPPAAPTGTQKPEPPKPGADYKADPYHEPVD